MNGGNPFLPLFDPNIDTFDSLRRKSMFCLVTVLYISLKQYYTVVQSTVQTPDLLSLRERCLTESRRLALESLFGNPATLDSVKAMILLAAHAGKTWFAIGHALQMAMDLGLDRSPTDLVEMNEPRARQSSEGLKLRERATVWLILAHIEKEVAYGTARQPRTPVVESHALRRFLELSACAVSDVRFLSTIEAVQVRGRTGDSLAGIDADQWLQAHCKEPSRISC